MAKTRFQLILAVTCLTLFAAVWLWQSPGGITGKITPQELEAYLATLGQMPIPPQDKAEVLRRMRSFGEADDGKPFYMLNLMRYHEALRRYPGASESNLTPAQANQHYENSVMGLLLKRGAYPLAAGAVQGESVLPNAAGDSGWDRMIVVRYPSRRAFFGLLTDPAYIPYAPYKFMAMDIALLPTETEMLWPEPRLLAAAVLLVVFLGLGWLRAARRSP